MKTFVLKYLFVCSFFLSCTSTEPPTTEDSFSDRWRSSTKIDLSNLLDWKAYLSKKGLPQSSGLESRDLYYRPKDKGFYYKYFYFEKLPKGALEVFSYIEGEEVGAFLEQDELFLGLKMKSEDTDLGKLNLVGKTAAELQNILGFPQMEKEQIWIYWDGAYALKVRFNLKEKVEQIHYLRSSGEIKTLAELWTHLNAS